MTACQNLAMPVYSQTQTMSQSMPQSVSVPSSEQEITLQTAPIIYTGFIEPIAQDYKAMEAWWSFFGDPILNSLVSSGLSMNASRLDKKEPFPKDNMIAETLEVYYKDKRVELVNLIVKDYVEYRYIQMQNTLLEAYIVRYKFSF